MADHEQRLGLVTLVKNRVALVVGLDAALGAEFVQFLWQELLE